MRVPVGKCCARVLLAFGVTGALTHCPAPRAPDEARVDDRPLVQPEAATRIEASTEPPEAGPEASAVDAALADADAIATPEAGPPRCTRVVLGQSARRAACTRDDECVLRPAGCCPPCGPVPASGVRAVDVGDDVLCNMACPACATVIPTTLRAECVKRRCVVVETTCDRTSALSCPAVRPPSLLPRIMPAAVASCAIDHQCALMVEDCCHCGVASGSDVIAVHRGKKPRCRAKGGCPDCLSEGIDLSLRAVCAEGRCRVRDLGLDPLCSKPVFSNLAP